MNLREHSWRQFLYLLHFKMSKEESSSAPVPVSVAVSDPIAPSITTTTTSANNNNNVTDNSSISSKATSSFWVPWWKWATYDYAGEPEPNVALLELSGFLFSRKGLKIPPAYIQGDPTIRLLVYPSNYGCPSFDPLCLQTLTYMRFLGQRYAIDYFWEPAISPSGDLPCLLNDYGYCIGGRESIAMAFEQKAGKVLDSKLSSDEQVFVGIEILFIIRYIFV